MTAAAFLRWREIPGGVWALGVVSLLMDLSSEMIHAVLPLYLVGGLGVSMLTLGLIEGVAEATGQIVKLASGALSDGLRRRKLLAVVGYGLAALTKPVFPLAGSLGWVVGARIVDRIGKGIRGAPRDALVADITPPALRGASFGLRQALDTVGAVLGPLVAMLLLALGATFLGVFWVAVIPAALAVAVLMVFVHEPQQQGNAPPRRAIALSSLRQLPSAFWAVVAVAVVFTLARFSEAFLLLRAETAGLSLAMIPAAMVVMNAVYAVSSWPAGALSDRLGRHAPAAVGLVVLVMAHAVLAWAHGVAAIGAGMALWGLHLGLTQGLLSALVADTAPAALRGTAFGVFNMITGIATLAASVIAGAVWQELGPAATFAVGGGFALLAALALAMLAARGGKSP